MISEYACGSLQQRLVRQSAIQNSLSDHFCGRDDEITQDQSTLDVLMHVLARLTQQWVGNRKDSRQGHH